MAERQKPFSQAEEPADAIPTPKAKRRRRWEREQRNDPDTMQVTYRGIPRALSAELKALAEAERVTVSELARLFLEYGLAAHQAGELVIETEPSKAKRSVVFGSKADVP